MRKMIELPTKVTTVDRRTKKVTESNSTMMMLPAKEGTCEVCATAHEPEMPHNRQSLFYQVRFNAENGRSPTWLDAMKHCSEDMQTHWKTELRKLGEKIGDEE